jgi:hypothetical protein
MHRRPAMAGAIPMTPRPSSPGARSSPPNPTGTTSSCSPTTPPTACSNCSLARSCLSECEEACPAHRPLPGGTKPFPLAGGCRLNASRAVRTFVPAVPVRRGIRGLTLRDKVG